MVSVPVPAFGFDDRLAEAAPRVDVCTRIGCKRVGGGVDGEGRVSLRKHHGVPDVAFCHVHHALTPVNVRAHRDGCHDVGPQVGAIHNLGCAGLRSRMGHHGNLSRVHQHHIFHGAVGHARAKQERRSSRPVRHPHAAGALHILPTDDALRHTSDGRRGARLFPLPRKDPGPPVGLQFLKRIRRGIEAVRRHDVQTAVGCEQRHLVQRSAIVHEAPRRCRRDHKRSWHRVQFIAAAVQDRNLPPRHHQQIGNSIGIEISRRKRRGIARKRVVAGFGQPLVRTRVNQQPGTAIGMHSDHQMSEFGPRQVMGIHGRDRTVDNNRLLNFHASGIVPRQHGDAVSAARRGCQRGPFGADQVPFRQKIRPGGNFHQVGFRQVRRRKIAARNGPEGRVALRRERIQIAVMDRDQTRAARCETDGQIADPVAIQIRRGHRQRRRAACHRRGRAPGAFVGHRELARGTQRQTIGIGMHQKPRPAELQNRRLRKNEHEQRGSDETTRFTDLWR